MATTFAIGDLHGRIDLLEAAIERLDRLAPCGGTVVFLGDYVDRGPDGRAVLERLLAGPPNPAWKWICLRGNHEVMMHRAVEGPARLARWLEDGGRTTLSSYGMAAGDSYDLSRIPAMHFEWLTRLPLCHVEPHRIYVHAGLDDGIPLSGQSTKVMLNKRYGPGDDTGFFGRHVVHGHDPRNKGPLRLASRTNMDVNGWYENRIAIGVFESAEPGGPIDVVDLPLKQPVQWYLAPSA